MTLYEALSNAQARQKSKKGTITKFNFINLGTVLKYIPHSIFAGEYLLCDRVPLMTNIFRAQEIFKIFIYLFILDLHYTHAIAYRARSRFPVMSVNTIEVPSPNPERSSANNEKITACKTLLQWKVFS